MSEVSATIKTTKKGKLMNKELFEKLVNLRTEAHTARFSDDGGAIARDEKTYQDALASQSEFTDEEITKESVSRWNEMIRRMDNK